MREKVLLTFDNGLRNTQDRVESLLDVLDKPPRLLKLLLQARRPRFALRAAQNLRIHVVDAQPWHDVRIERRDPPAAALAHEHVGHHEVGLGTVERMPRIRRQRANQFVSRLQCYFVHLERFL
ncbi:hypothetical protein D3C86_1331360 [compost metagenome]